MTGLGERRNALRCSALRLLPQRQLPFRTASGAIRIEGTDPAARQDALTRVPAFLARFLLN
jgi:hypothetical protein